MPETVIRTENLTRDFRSTRAVDAINIAVPAGIVFGFLGPNGSGKTTTIRMLLGIVAPTSGLASILGFDAATQPNEIRSASVLPNEWKASLAQALMKDNLLRTEVIAGAVLLSVSALLFVAARLRFRRSRLLLD